MKAFADLHALLEETTKATAKVRALRDYFARVPPADAAWAVSFLVGRKPRRIVPSAKLREWAAQEAAIPDWLFQESYDAVGDMAETIALLLPAPVHSSDQTLSRWIEDRLLPLYGRDEKDKRSLIQDAWRELDPSQRFIWNKLISGGFRVGVSQQLVIQALADLAGVDPPVVAHRLMGDWSPTPDFFAGLLARDASDADPSRPYPFFLAQCLDQEPTSLGDRALWQVEWKWDGLRCQLIRRDGFTYVWSRDQELITSQYPELTALGELFPDGTVLDGAILPCKGGSILPFIRLERRIGRKNPTRVVLAETPVILIVHDLLEHAGVDLREQSLDARRDALTALIGDLTSRSPWLESRVWISPIVRAPTWTELATIWAQSRDEQAQGLMLKRRDSAYGVGRSRDDWWKWKVEPFTIDAVLTAARRGSGERAGLYTDYTLAVWNDGVLITIAQADSNLTDAEIRQIDAFVRQNILERFGPVRTVKPELVFEIAFEGLARSRRHKSGLALRFPRVVRIRGDRTADQAGTLAVLEALLLKADEPVSQTKKTGPQTQSKG